MREEAVVENRATRGWRARYKAGDDVCWLSSPPGLGAGVVGEWKRGRWGSGGVSTVAAALPLGGFALSAVHSGWVGLWLGLPGERGDGLRIYFGQEGIGAFVFFFQEIVRMCVV